MLKKMKDKITSSAIAFSRNIEQKEFDPVNNPRDQLVTFLLCDEFDCSNEIISGRIKKKLGWFRTSSSC